MHTDILSLSGKACIPSSFLLIMSNREKGRSILRFLQALGKEIRTIVKMIIIMWVLGGMNAAKVVRMEITDMWKGVKQ